MNVPFTHRKGLSLSVLLITYLIAQPLMEGGLGELAPFAITVSEPRDVSLKIGNGNLTVRWKGPEVGSSTVTGYNIFRSLGSDEFSLLISVLPAVNEHVDLDVINGQRYSYRITAVNLVEESDPSETVQGAPDGEPPFLRIDSPKEGAFKNSTTIMFSWFSDDESGLLRIETSLDNGPFLERGLDTMLNGTGLEEGPHLFRLRATDVALNSVIVTVNFTVDVTPPTLRMVNPIEKQVLDMSSIDFIWEGEDPVSGVKGYRFRLDGDRELDLGSSTGRTADHLNDGKHTVEVACLDRAGNHASVRTAFTVDLEPPVARIIEPMDGSYIGSTSVDVRWYGADSATDVVSYLVLDGLPPLRFDGMNAHIYSDLSEGEHRLGLGVVDGAGRTTNVSSDFTIDTVPPTVEITWPRGDAPVNSREVSFIWEVRDDGSEGARSFVSVDGGPFEGVSGLGMAIVDLKEDGSHNFSVIVEDRAGNRGHASVEFTVDTERPRVVGYGPVGDGIRTIGTIWVLYDEDIDPVNAMIGVEGDRGVFELRGERNLTFTVLDNPRYGEEYLVSTTVSDLAGNQLAGFSWAFVLTDLGTVRGRVVDVDGRPVPEARVVLDDGRSTRTGPDGTFDIEGEYGERTLFISKDGMKRLEKMVYVEPAGSRDLGELVLERRSGDERQVFFGNLSDPLTAGLFVLFVIVVLLAVLNLWSFLKERALRIISKKGSAGKSNGQEKDRSEVGLGNHAGHRFPPRKG